MRLRAAFLLLLFFDPARAAEARRVVVLKMDGLPAGLLEEMMGSRDPRTGKSRLPWFDEVFVRHGARLANFYVRGISLSAPSWAMLDTGQHQRIHGNVEYDRFTLRPYDYLNFFPFYLGNASGKRDDMPGVEVLDASGVPLLLDSFPAEERYQSFQLFQRGVRWKSLERGLRNRFLSRSPKELFDEWQVGFEFQNSVSEQTERELISHLADSHFLYLDYFSGEFDHIAHLTNDRQAQIAELRRIDALVGRVWTAIQASPLREQTVLALLSDHGMNSVPGTYSQGYNLVDWFGSIAGGAHHTATDRHPQSEYKLRGLNPMVSEVITPSSQSIYLKSEAEHYPTVYLDLDGNERAAVQLRNSDLNQLHILLRQIGHSEGAEEAFFDLLNRKHEAWLRRLPELQGTEYARVMANLLNLMPGRLSRQRLKIDELIPRRTLGERNTIYDLQNYAVGFERRVDYFKALRGIRVRNNVQAEVGPAPVDFVAARTPAGVWLYSDEEHQALVQSRTNDGADLELRYLPVAGLRGLPDGSVTWSDTGWKADLPLRLWEDSAVPAGFLDGWHTDREWLAATCRGRYSNGVVGIHEQFLELDQRGRAVAPDLVLFANDHWNFNVRGFNPGGNHGSFLQISMHSVMMFSGGGVPAGLRIEQPYDSLSFVPTVLRLVGRPGTGLPGPVIGELFR